MTRSAYIYSPVTRILFPFFSFGWDVEFGRDVEFLHPTSLVHTRSRGLLDGVSKTPSVSNPSLADLGENSRNTGELQAESANTNDVIRVSDSPLDMELTLKDHKKISKTINDRPNFSTPQTRSHFAKFFSE